MTKDQYDIAKEIIQGYYNRIIIQSPSIEKVIEWLESDLEVLAQEDAVFKTNDLIMNYDPHDVSKVECNICQHNWVAVRPKGVIILECPNCKTMVNI